MLTAIKVPKQVTEDLDRVRRCFLWAADGEVSGGKCKVAWPYVTMPIEYGGLGVLDFEKFSRALRVRWLWFAWSNPQRPWNGTPLPVDDSDLALFAAATKVTVRSGHGALFWHSNWTQGRPLSKQFPRLYSHSKRKYRTVSKALHNATWIRDI